MIVPDKDSMKYIFQKPKDVKNMTPNEQIDVLIKALEESLSIQKQYAKAIEELKQENQFLVDTIKENFLE